MPIGRHPQAIVLETREPLLVNERRASVAARAQARSRRRHPASPPKSLLFVPLIVGDRGASGASRSRTSTARTRSATSDVRLLTTLAASLSVALENARLFDETQRLLTETDERAAELAIINSVQQGLAAATSTCRRCTTWWATRSRRSSTRRWSTSASSTRTSGRDPFPYTIERGVRSAHEPMDVDRAPASSVLETPRAARRQRARRRCGCGVRPAGRPLGRDAQVVGLRPARHR